MKHPLRAPRRTLAAALATTGALALVPTAAHAVVATPLPAVAVDGTVNATLRVGDTVYLGGAFTSLGTPTGAGVVLDAAGAVDADTAALFGGGATVTAVTDDGRGGWYVAGDFARAGDTARGRVVRLDAAGRVDPAFRPPAPTGAVYDLLRVGDTVYVAGSFSAVGDATRSNLAALDATTGALREGFAPVLNGWVNVLAHVDGRVVAGGGFTRVGGALHVSLAALDPVTGAADATEYGLSRLEFGGEVYGTSQVTTLAARDTTLYVGGVFSDLGGARRARIGAVDVRTGQATAFAPAVDGSVNALALRGDELVVGGLFEHAGGAARDNLAALRLADGTATAFDVGVDNAVEDLAVQGDIAHVVGFFDEAGDRARGHYAAVDLTTGAVTPADPRLGGVADQVAAAGGRAFVGGRVVSAGATPRRGLAAVDARDGRLLPWDPNKTTDDPGGEVRALARRGDTILAGGSFRRVGGRDLPALAALDATTGTPAPGFVPEPAGSNGASAAVDALAVDGDDVVAGGTFTRIGGADRARLARLRVTDGTATDWRADADGAVHALAVDGDALRVGGAFTTLGGEPRARLGAVGRTDGAVTDWRADADGAVRALLPRDGRVLVGGPFKTLAGQPRAGLGAVAADGAASAFDAALTSARSSDTTEVRALADAGDRVVVGGAFAVAGGVAAPRLAAVDPVTGAADPAFAPGPDGTVRSLAVAADGTVDVGGAFRTLASAPAAGLALLGTPRSVPPPVDETPPGTDVPPADGAPPVDGTPSPAVPVPPSAVSAPSGTTAPSVASPPSRAMLRLVAPRVAASALRSGRARVRLTSSMPGTARVSLVVDARTRRALGLPRRTVASGALRVRRAERVSVRLRPAPGVARRLRSGRTFVATLRVSVRSTHDGGTLRRTVRLRVRG